ncbi:MAG: hypothetical protein RM338_07615, partial [Nostoc sp. DedQUE12a]|nr:hypothetical protein [Nostoc sp. DedQUE12a]
WVQNTVCLMRSPPRYYSSLQLNEVQNQGFTNQIILLPPAFCLLPPASKPVTLYFMQKKTAVNF